MVIVSQRWILFPSSRHDVLLTLTVTSCIYRTHDKGTTIWDATSAAPGSSIDFVVASQHGLMRISLGHPECIDSNINMQEVLAVSSLSHMPSTFLSGTRTGRILLRDYRTRDHDAQERELFQHPGSIFRIRQLDTN